MLTKSQNCSWSNRRLHEYRHIFVGKITIFRGFSSPFWLGFLPFSPNQRRAELGGDVLHVRINVFELRHRRGHRFRLRSWKKVSWWRFFIPIYQCIYIYIYQCAMVKLLLLDCIHSLWEIVISPFSQGYGIYIYIYVFCIYIYTLIMFGFPI